MTSADTPIRDATSRSWRPLGFWALTINVSLGFPAILTGVVLRPEAPWATVTGAYASLLMCWATAAGIRQWGKSRGDA